MTPQDPAPEPNETAPSLVAGPSASRRRRGAPPSRPREGHDEALHSARVALQQGARLVWQAPGSGRWNGARWRAFLGFGGAPPAPADIAPPAGFGALRLECAVERAGGRAYAIFAAADAPANDAARCEAR